MLAVAVVDTVDEAVSLANASDYSLSSALWTKDMRQAFAVARRIRAGQVFVNGSTVGFETTFQQQGWGYVVKHLLRYELLGDSQRYTEGPLATGRLTSTTSSIHSLYPSKIHRLNRRLARPTPEAEDAVYVSCCDTRWNTGIC